MLSTLAIVITTTMFTTSPATPSTLSIEADTHSLQSGGEAVREHIERRAAEAFPDSQIGKTSGHTLTCAITVQEVERPKPGYTMTLTLQLDGEPVSDKPRAQQCSLCSESELIEAAVQELRAFLVLADAAREQDERAEAHRAPPPATSSEDQPEEAAEEEDTEESPDDRDAPVEPRPAVREERVEGPVDTGRDDLEPRALTPTGKAGVGLLVSGALGLGVGVGLAVRAATPRPQNPLEVLDTRPVGWGILAASGAATIVAATLLGLDRRQQRQVYSAPMASARQLGWQLHVEF